MVPRIHSDPIRDIKSANIMMGTGADEDMAFLIDFGLAEGMSKEEVKGAKTTIKLQNLCSGEAEGLSAYFDYVAATLEFTETTDYKKTIVDLGKIPNSIPAAIYTWWSVILPENNRITA
ncbi:hypothetical protein BDB00DRAFT_786900 [Zychaea mexicana]|uniref:uncharacterized protein n=1 Tax=Zychaea mexicana TaxID=64656 RepID=UPI0022FF1911|nr:uncharacterized protein BDB00DRAFT_786900 [Zychaea mexicana]KAI9494794.1 hypothetical protein BDB00DRAFT_786900 [Zychaea mexicana]